MTRTTTFFTFLAAALAASPAAALDLISNAGHRFDVRDTSDGSLSDGTSDSYDGMYYLRVDGSQYTSGGTSTMSLGGRQVEMAEQPMGTLMVRRLFYVPDTTMAGPTSSWGRYLDVIRNPGASPVSTTIEITGNLGSDSSTVVTATSSGDTLVSTADDWFATDDSSDGGGDASLAHVMAGPGGAVALATASISGDTPTWSFMASVPAGGQIAVMTFVIQHDNRAAAHAEAANVVALPPEALVGLDAFLSDIINFDAGTSTPNDPPTEPSIVSPMDGARLMETMPMLVAGNATDPDGDALSYLFQIDNTSSFSSPFLIESPLVAETPAQTSWTVPRNLTAEQWWWRVRASDGRANSGWVAGTFVVGDAPFVDAGPGGDGGPGVDGGPLVDAGPGIRPRLGRGGRGCCHVAGSEQQPMPPALPWLLLGVWLVVSVRRAR